MSTEGLADNLCTAGFLTWPAHDRLLTGWQDLGERESRRNHAPMAYHQTGRKGKVASRPC